MKKIRIELRTLSPVVLSTRGFAGLMTETQKSFSGTVLRGVFAKAYIEAHGLGRAAHEDEGFSRLFFGGVRFVAALPADAEGERSFVLPASLQRPKKGTEADKDTHIHDLLKDEREAVGYKSFKGLGVAKGNTIYRLEPKTSIRLHMSRSGEKERLLGSSLDGKMYNYEAIDEGQLFVGYAIGEEADLKALLALTEGGRLLARIGRSKYTQYGACELHLSEPEPIENVTAKGDTILLRLDTPLISAHASSAARMLEELPEELEASTGQADEFSLGRVYASPWEGDSFVGIWGMQSPEATGLAAGSVFELKKKSAWDEKSLAALTSLCCGGVGARTYEGFGQLRIWPREAFSVGEKKKPVPIAKKKAIPQAVAAQVKAILSARLREQLGILAGDDVQGMGRLSGRTHSFSRLYNMLEDARRQGDMGAMARAVGSEKQSTPLGDALRNILIGGMGLGNALKDVSVTPAGSRLSGCFTDDVKGLMSRLGLKEGDVLSPGERYYEYWHAALRLARKKSVTDKEEN